MAAAPPATSVLTGFGLSGRPVRLQGGQGSSWLVGEVVLKPLDLAEAELTWQEEVLASITCDGFRIARPLRARDGSLIVEGWCAWEAVEGRHEERRCPEIIAVGERFHSALVGIPRPDFVARRTDPWAIGDRVAWGELPAAEFAHVKHVPRSCLPSSRSPLPASSSTVTSPATCCSTKNSLRR